MQSKVTRLFHVGWPVGPVTSPGKIIPSLNLNMHMCSSTCTGQNNNHKWNMGTCESRNTGTRNGTWNGLERIIT